MSLLSRKDAQDNDNMDDFLGSGVVAHAAATRIKLYRNENKLNMHVKVRHAERPDKTSLVWKYPLLEVASGDLNAKRRSQTKCLGKPEGQGKYRSEVRRPGE